MTCAPNVPQLALELGLEPWGCDPKSRIFPELPGSCWVSELPILQSDPLSSCLPPLSCLGWGLQTQGP